MNGVHTTEDRSTNGGTLIGCSNININNEPLPKSKESQMFDKDERKRMAALTKTLSNKEKAVCIQNQEQIN